METDILLLALPAGASASTGRTNPFRRFAPAPPKEGAKGMTGALLASPFERRPPAGGRCRVATKRGQGVTEGDGEGASRSLRGAAAAAAEGPINRRSEKNVQQRRPPPAADAGRSCWGSGLQDVSAAQGTKQTQGAATRRLPRFERIRRQCFLQKA